MSCLPANWWRTEMKILLIASNRIGQPLPAFPLGAAYLAGNIDPKAHSVDVLDLMFEDNFRESVASGVSRAKPDIIGVSIRNVDAGGVNLLREIEEIVQICRRENEARIVLGSSAGPASRGCLARSSHTSAQSWESWGKAWLRSTDSSRGWKQERDGMTYRVSCGGMAARFE
jgi:hypothetical protein